MAGNLADDCCSVDIPDDVVVLAGERSKMMKVFCPICRKVYKNPYIASCGHTFCHQCVSSSTHSVCPLDNGQLTLLVGNLTVADEVGDLEIHCRYGCKPRDGFPGEYEHNQQGCPATVKLRARLEHENECEYAPVECPNSSICRRMLRKDLKDHLSTCKYVRCPYHKYNCPFQGSRDELEEHLQICKFEGVKGFLNRMDEQLASLQEEVKLKDALIEQLTSSVANLTTKLEVMEKAASISSHRMDHLEKQHSEMREEVVHTKSSVRIMKNELKLVQKQLGLAGTIEPRHLFQCQGTFVGHKGPVWALCKCGDFLFSGSSDNTIKVWNLSELYAGPRTMTGHDGIVLALCTQGDHLFSGSSDNTIKVWNNQSLELLASFKGHDDPVCTLACNESFLFSGSLRSIKVWDNQTHKLVRKLPTQNHWIRALVVVGKYIYSGSYKAVKIWSVETLEVVHVLQCEGGSVYSLAVTDKHIICGVYENLIHVWDVHSLQEIGTLTGHVGAVYSLAVLNAPGQTRLFSASYDKTIRVWNTALMTCSQTLARHEGSVTCLTVSRGRIFSGAVDSNIKAWQ